MKKLSYRFFGILLCVSVLLCGFGTERTHGSVYRFTDIGFSQSGCYTEYLICAVKHSLLFGTSESTVSPDRKITWGEIITILGRVHESVSRKKLPQTAGERFYSRYVSWAKSSGLLKNIEIAAYFAEQSMTRECYGWVQEQFLVEGYYAKIEGYFE